MMPEVRSIPVALALLLSMAPALAAQREPSRARVLSPAETGCDTARAAAPDSVFEADEVDRPVQARRLPIEDMPLRVHEVLSGRSVFRFIVEPSGRIDRCSIELVEETSRAWTDAVLRELRGARYEPARRGGRPVRQRAYQVFTYHNDGRLQEPR